MESLWVSRIGMGAKNPSTQNNVRGLSTINTLFSWWWRGEDNRAGARQEHASISFLDQWVMHRPHCDISSYRTIKTLLIFTIGRIASSPVGQGADHGPDGVKAVH